MGRYPEHRVGQLALGITTGHTSRGNLKDRGDPVFIQSHRVPSCPLLTDQSRRGKFNLVKAGVAQR